VKYEDITSVLNFMYHGEVSVAQEELNTFLAVAEDLKVKGLYQHDQPEQLKDYQEHKDTLSIGRKNIFDGRQDGYLSKISAMKIIHFNAPISSKSLPKNASCPLPS
jgi:hypothetical protein